MMSKESNHRRRPGRWRSERAQALVEFALISIVFFMLVFSIFDLARLFQSWVTVQHAARESARYAITGQVLCEGYTTGDHRDDCITQAAKTATTGVPDGGPGSTAVNVSTKYWDYPTYSGVGSSGAGEPCDQVEVRVTYQHHFVTPIMAAIISSGVPLAGIQRMTNEPFGSCS